MTVYEILGTPASFALPTDAGRWRGVVSRGLANPAVISSGAISSTLADAYRPAASILRRAARMALQRGDDLVHLAFGALAMCPLVEISRKYGGLRVPWARVFAVSVALGVSAFYEVFEWLLTVVAAPDYADSYNGQQGDIWDAQKDMALAALGALLLLPFVGSKNLSS